MLKFPFDWRISCIVSSEQERCSRRWQNTDLHSRKPLRDDERCGVNVIPESTRYKNKWAARIFERVISHVSATLGPNPYTGKVESEQEKVVFKEKELNCNLGNKSSSFLSFGDFQNCNGTFNVSSK